MQKIIPQLWFDKEAKEASNFYVSVFPNSKILSIHQIHNTPSGDCDIISFSLMGQEFRSISAGPYFKFNPSISFIVNCKTEEEVDDLWKKLSNGGKVLMPLDKYPFSERYGWTEDKYGLSWQLILVKSESDDRSKIIPSLLFVGDVYGKAEEAVRFYTSIFKKSKMGNIMKYGPNQQPDQEGKVIFCDFKLEDLWLAAMDSAHEHKFKFNEAISFIVNCDNQKEIDYYWPKLSAVPESEQCGWLKDKYGISWQITPKDIDEMIQKGSKEQIAQVTKAFLKMKKFNLAELKKAYNGR
ncbi:VOC family protein [Candidatus Micrarchaeota archaeon]|nr:VOC family protein [Candidatus Micrarchaeota archaeon]